MEVTPSSGIKEYTFYVYATGGLLPPSGGWSVSAAEQYGELAPPWHSKIQNLVCSSSNYVAISELRNILPGNAPLQVPLSKVTCPLTIMWL